jgi:hypothetical protein
VSVIANYGSPERHLLETLAEDPAKQDSVLTAQERQKTLEEEQQKAQREKEEKEKAEEERMKAELERQHAAAIATSSNENVHLNNVDTVR